MVVGSMISKQKVLSIFVVNCCLAFCVCLFYIFKY